MGKDPHSLQGEDPPNAAESVDRSNCPVFGKPPVIPFRNQDNADIPWFSLARMAFCAQAFVKKRLKQVAESADLSAVEALLLLCCRDAHKGISQQELVRFTGCSAGLVSSRIESLLQRAFVTSRRNPDDRRHQFWQITKAGSEIADQLLKQLETGDWSELRELGTALTNFTAAKPESCPPNHTDADDGDRGLAA